MFELVFFQIISIVLIRLFHVNVFCLSSWFCICFTLSIFILISDRTFYMDTLQELHVPSLETIDE